MNARRFILAVAKSYFLMLGVLVLGAVLWTRLAAAAEGQALPAGTLDLLPEPWFAGAALLALALLAAIANWRRLVRVNRRLETSLGALHRAEGEIRGLAEFVSENPSPVLRIDGDGRIVYANLAALDLIPIRADSRPIDPDVAESLRRAAEEGGEEIRFDREGRNWSFIAIRVHESGNIDLFGREETREREAAVARRESEERVRLAVEALDAGIWDWDIRSGTVYRSPRLLEMLGLRADFPSRMEPWTELYHPDDLAHVAQARDALLAGESDRMDLLYRLRGEDGAYRWVRSHSRVVQCENGKPFRVIGMLTDVTEQRENEERLKLQAAALQAAGTAVIVTDSNGAIEWVNPAYTRMSGFQPEQLRGRKPAIFEKLFGNGDSGMLHELMASGRVWQSEHSDRRSDGQTYQVKQMVTPIAGKNGEITHFVATLDDVTAQREAEQRIRRLAHFDELTALPNRTLFRERLASAIEHADRWQKPFALLLLDLDHFKDINDTLGHHIGDALLKQVASALNGCLRTPDTLARLGGDEFAVIIADLRDGDDAARLADRILASFAGAVTVEGNAIDVTPSIGITLYPSDTGTPDDLLRNADLAMYQAKADGRALYRFYDSDLQAAALDRAMLARDLRHAIGSDELYLRYQPKVDLASGRMIGAEALLRWRHPEQGEVPPARFVAVAEETGLIAELGGWTLRHVCAQLAHWKRQGLPPVPVAVNLSGVQLSQSGLAGFLRSTLEEHGVEPGLLEVEITETVLMKSTQRAMENLAALDRLGIQISLDDFGTGYSSLAYLSRFPVRRLKVDMTFVQGIGRNPNDEAIVKAVVGLAHNLNIRALAEGVETEEQARFLRQLRCDEVQGFLMSRPLLEADFVAFMKHSVEPALTGS
ncbi:MAG: EAL domain-containing protein [Acetobacterales bacterium]